MYILCDILDSTNKYLIKRREFPNLYLEISQSRIGYCYGSNYKDFNDLRLLADDIKVIIWNTETKKYSHITSKQLYKLCRNNDVYASKEKLHKGNKIVYIIHFLTPYGFQVAELLEADETNGVEAAKKFAPTFPESALDNITLIDFELEPNMLFFRFYNADDSMPSGDVFIGDYLVYLYKYCTNPCIVDINNANDMNEDELVISCVMWLFEDNMWLTTYYLYYKVLDKEKLLQLLTKAKLSRG